MVTADTRGRWFQLTPDGLIFALLALEGCLFLFGRFHWFSFNQYKGWVVLITLMTVGLAMLLMLLWFAIAVVLRWRFQFSIRSLLVLVVAAAVPCSWLAVEIKEAREQKRAVEVVTGRFAAVEYDYERDSHYNPVLGAEPPAPIWLRKWLGDDFFVSLASVNFTGQEVVDADLACVNGLTEVKELCVGSTKVTDAGLVHLRGFHQLQRLWLDKTHVTDAGLSHLQGLTRLLWLYLGNTDISDAGLVNLQSLTRLQRLDLESTHVTDIGLESIKGLSQLQELKLTGTKTTAEGVKKLQQALPNCRIRK